MKLFYRKSGEGRPLIIMHGVFGMSDNWMTLSKQFAESGFCVYAVDARNHGRSPHDDEFNYHVMADDLLELMNDENITTASVIGHSMGGKVAMFFAAQHPERISKLIISDITPKHYPSSNQNVIAAIRSVDLSSITTRKEAEASLRETLNSEATIQFLLKNLYWNEQNQLAWRFNVDAIQKGIEITEEALPASYHFDGPTLFLRGERSEYITEADAGLIKQHFPNAIMETVPDAGHWIHADNPAGFMESVLKFLN